MLSLITNPSTDKRLVEIALSILRSIFQHPLAPIVEINTNTNFLKDIIGMSDDPHVIRLFHLTLLFFRSCIFRKFYSMSIMCGKHFSPTVSFIQRTDAIVSHWSYTISCTINNHRLFGTTNSRVKMSGCNVFHE